MCVSTCGCTTKNRFQATHFLIPLFPWVPVRLQLRRTWVIYSAACCIIPLIAFSSTRERFHFICQVCARLAATLAAWWARIVGKLPLQGDRCFYLSCKTDVMTDNSPAISYPFRFIWGLEENPSKDCLGVSKEKISLLFLHMQMWYGYLQSVVAC